MATTRHVKVRLDADTGAFVRGMTTAQAAVRGLTREIDTSNDRTAWLAQSILALGPALVPLGAAAVPVLSGLTMQLGLTAAAAGTAALAFNGVGDALKSVNEYETEPTAENFQKMQVELEKLGPAGAEFVRFLDDVGPKFRSLQIAAREGMFPGVEDGITSFLDVLPRVRGIVGDTAEAMGDLSRQAGAGLAGEGFSDFFDYLERDAKPMLIEMGQTVGNFAEGLAGMLVGLEPLTQGFSAGFLEMSQSFSDWSHGLEANSSFQGFVDYVQQSIPKALDALGALGGAFVSLLQAMAPVGDVMLPILEGLFDAMSVFLDTPLGPTFLAIAAALSAYGRAAALVSITTGNLGRVFSGTAISATALRSTFITNIPTLRQFGLAAMFAAHSTTTLHTAMLSGSKVAADGARSAYLAKDAVGSFARSAAPAAAAAGLFALSMSDLDDKAGLTNATMGAMLGMIGGPLGMAIGGAAGATIDLSNANDDLSAAIDKANRAMASDQGVSTLKRRYAEVKQELDEVTQAQDDMWGGRDNAGENVFERIGNDIKTTWKGVGGYMTDAVGEGKVALSELKTAMGNTGGIADLFASQIGMTARQMRIAAGDAQALGRQLAILSGWLDKREALRGYADSVRALRKELDKGFSRDMVENLDAVGRSIIQVAENMKDGPARIAFIEDAIVSLNKLANNAGPKAEAEVRKLIRQLEKFGSTESKAKLDADDNPARKKIDRANSWLLDYGDQKPTPKLDANDKPAKDKINSTDRLLADLSGTTARPKVDVTSNAAQVAAAANQWLNTIADEDVFINVRTRRSSEGAGTGFGPSAYGNLFPSVRSNAYGDVANAHQPELAGPGVTRIWREPETQGEAYIPLANDGRRPRAEAIWEQTGRMLGIQFERYAFGGVRAVEPRASIPARPSGGYIRERIVERLPDTIVLDAGELGRIVINTADGRINTHQARSFTNQGRGTR